MTSIKNDAPSWISSTRWHDGLLLGIPRSGTTLCCSLLNRLPDTVALVEPMAVQNFFGRPPADWRRILADFFGQVRRQIRQKAALHLPVLPEGHDDNTFAACKGENGLRRPVIRQGRWQVDKPLSSRFRLLLKHPNAFTAMLPELVQFHPCFALIRHPLAVLASWNTLDLPLRQGHAPAAEALDPALRRRLERISDPIARQIELLSWYFERYRSHLPPRAILRYEDLVATPGRCLQAIVPEAAAHAWPPLRSRNRNPLYDRRLMARLRRRLLDTDGAFWYFYSPDES